MVLSIMNSAAGQFPTDAEPEEDEEGSETEDPLPSRRLRSARAPGAAVKSIDFDKMDMTVSPTAGRCACVLVHSPTPRRHHLLR